MLVASFLAGRWGHLLRRLRLGYVGLILVGLLFAGLGLLSMDYQRLLQPILQVYPGAAFSLTTGTMFIGLLLGLCMSTVNILAQTVLQRESPAHLRGRVFSVQFMLNNLIGIPPMLVLGGIADAVGIPPVLIIAGLITIGMALLSLLIRGRAIRFPVLRKLPAATQDSPERADGPPRFDRGIP
jgi:MFS family permease